MDAKTLLTTTIAMIAGIAWGTYSLFGKEMADHEWLAQAVLPERNGSIERSPEQVERSRQTP